MKLKFTVDIDPRRLAKSFIITLILCVFVLAVAMVAMSAIEAAKVITGYTDDTIYSALGITLMLLVFKFVYDTEGKR